MPRPSTAPELREAFLSFFEQRGHLRMQAASLIPANDPTLLLTNSGMAQFKQYFSGELEPPRPRITTSQKSFRTTDIESVGDATHLTLFEMLGNFSFGDYFKKEACAWALEFMTSVLQFPHERLYFTVYQDDDEAVAIWRGLGVPQERIYRFGAKDNFWGPAGEEGPCGPCSEIHVYNGDLKKVPTVGDPVRKSSWGPNLHRDFVELYNLVFTQLYHHADGHRTELPKKNIDTGMGLERVLVILQGVKNIYETDAFRPLIARAEQLSGKEWGDDPETSRALSVVAEHGRSASFLIGDGVIPGNTGRGYVLRRLIRRGMLFGRRIGLTGSFLPDMADVSAEVMGQAYPELVRNGPFIKRVLQLEEERFARTLEFGSTVLEGMVEYRSGRSAAVPGIIKAVRENPSAALAGLPSPSQGGGQGVGRTQTDDSSPFSAIGIPTGDDAKSVGRRAAAERLANLVRSLAEARAPAGRRGTQAASEAIDAAEKSVASWPAEISGPEAFLLYDTYGFPVEVTREVLEGARLTVDSRGFDAEMRAQRERGRAGGQKFGGDAAKRHVYEDLGVDETPFLGYHATEAASVVIGIVRDGELVQSAEAGHKVEVILRETPFYAEKGGQVGDTGILSSLRPSGEKASIISSPLPSGEKPSSISSPLPLRERARVRGDQGGVVGGEAGALLEVSDTQNPYAHVISHTATVTRGSLKIGDAVTAAVDSARRERIRRNHTATHILHAALREVVGEHVRQAGSLVAPDRLRFDFTHMAALTPEELRRVQERANEQVRANTEVHVEETTYSNAVQKGALAFFGDKYENDVRAVCIVGVHEHEGHSHRDECWSYELCGGTHMDRTGGIGACIIVSESGIGAGLRRIEAVTGAAADHMVAERFGQQDQLASMLRVPVAGTQGRVEALMKELDASRKKLAALEDQLLQARLGGSGQQEAKTLQVDIGGEAVNVQVSSISADSPEALRRAGDLMREKLGSGVVVVGSVINGQPSVVVMVSKDLTGKGLHAGNIAKALAAVMGGGGGGRPDAAQAGGKDPSKLDEALASVQAVITSTQNR
jgi:alanyl-tRNA synthetase